MAAEMPETKENVAFGAAPNSRGPIRFRLLISLCAAFVAGVGFVALLGWILELPVLASLGSGMIPVAPSTAVLFVLYACAIFLRTYLPKGRVSYWAGVSINAAGLLVAMCLFILSVQDIQPDVEHLGFTIVNRPGETPVGHMSPVTAFCFLLSAFSYLLSLLLSRGRRWTANIAWWLACGIITIGTTLVLAYLYGTPILYGSAFIPPAVLTGLAFMALGTALLALAAPQAWTSRPNVEYTTRASYMLLLVFFILAAGIVIAGFLYYRSFEIRHRTEVEHQLAAIAGLKADGIVNWRKERLADAELFYQNDNFSIRVKNYFQKPEDDETGKKLLTWLQHIREGQQYDRVFLLDVGGRERLSVPEALQPISRRVILSAVEVLRTKQIAFEDFYRNEHDGRVYLAMLVPILDEQDNSRAVGTLVLRIAPEQYFYPFLSRWPTPSETAETLLVRGEGNEAVFLNELRFQKNTALNLRRALDQKELPAVQAVLGRQGIMEGRDYRGVPVMADLRAVPGSPWFLVSRMNISEVYGPMREKLWMTVVLVMALLIGAGGGVGLVWRRQRTQFYREKCETAEALEEKNAELERFIYTISHDLKSPLVTVKTFLGYLREDLVSADAERIEKDMGYMRTAAEKMGLLLDELLEMSRVGRVVNPPVTVSFRELVDEALNAVAGSIAERKVEVRVSDEAVMLYGDRPRLVEIWQNLVENAVKFVGDKALPRIEIGVEHEGSATIFFVRDNGMGIDPRYREKVFGLFDKLDPKSDGSGLGLALVKRIVEMYKGKIWLESEGPGKGACFRFTLPEAINKQG